MQLIYIFFYKTSSVANNIRTFTHENDQFNTIQMVKQNFVNIQDLNKEELLYLIQMAQEFEKYPNRELLKGRIIATLFYEPSTRTRLSFETDSQYAWVLKLLVLPMQRRRV